MSRGQLGRLTRGRLTAHPGSARNLVLLGDPRQLAQPSQAAHPPGAGASALEHILGDHATILRMWACFSPICGRAAVPPNQQTGVDTKVVPS